MEFSRVFVRPADRREDREAILTVLKSCFTDYNYRRYEWLYEDNPCGKAHTFLATGSAADRVIGCVSLFPRRVVIEGKRYLVGVAGDFAVVPGARGYVGLLLQKKLVEHGRAHFDFLYGFPNSLSIKVLERVGFVDIGTLPRYVKVIKVNEKIREKHGVMVSKLISPVSNFLLRITAPENSYAKQRNLRDEVSEYCDGRVDDFWERLRAATGIVGWRDSGFMNWKYLRNPDQKCKIFMVSENSTSHLLGYVVFFVSEHKCMIADVQYIGGPTVLMTVLGRFLLYVRLGRVASLVSVLVRAPEEIIGALHTLGFYERERSDCFMVRVFEGAAVDLNLIRGNNWNVFRGDRDV